MSISESITPTSPQKTGSLVSQNEFVSPTSPLPKASISPLKDAYMTTRFKLYPILEGECDPSDLLMLPIFLNGRVSCGSGEPHNEGDIYFLPQSKSFLKTKFNLLSTGALGIIQAIGNSMHPTMLKNEFFARKILNLHYLQIDNENFIEYKKSKC